MNCGAWQNTFRSEESSPNNGHSSSINVGPLAGPKRARYDPIKLRQGLLGDARIRLRNSSAVTRCLNASTPLNVITGMSSL